MHSRANSRMGQTVERSVSLVLEDSVPCSRLLFLLLSSRSAFFCRFSARRGGFGDVSLPLPVPAGCTVLPLLGPGLWLPTGRLPRLQGGLQLQTPSL